MTTHIATAAHATAANEPLPNPARHPWLELAGRYRAVVSAAWAMRHELAGPRRLADEAAFLPAALSLQETPVHPAPRRLAIAICTFFGLAILWSVFGQLDIVAVAQGRVMVSERTKTIQPLDAGVVKRVLVRDGDTVSAGQVLVELDPTQASADGASVAVQRRAAEAEAERAAALLQALRQGRAPWLPATDADGTGDLRNAQTLAEWHDLTARLARLGAEQARRESEVATVREAIAKLEATLPLAQQREADVKQLAAQGFMSGHAGQDRTRERIELERDLAVQRAHLAEAQAGLREALAARTAFLAETERALRQRQADATTQRDQLAHQERKTEQRQRLASLTAPVAGTVQQLAVHTPGGVVTPAQVLMVIVPAADSAPAEGSSPGGLTAEVLVDNADIGFVHVGQRAAIKVEAFPFTRYGTIEATVERIAADAVVDERRGAVFPATLRLERAAIDVGGKTIRLAPGMNITAEIKTGRRPVHEYWLAPVRQAMSESLGER
jgi:hemolysin D